MTGEELPEVLAYQGPGSGLAEWLAWQGWSEDERKPYVTYEEHANTVTTGWILTFPVFDEPEVEWFSTPLSAEAGGSDIQDFDDAVEVAKQYLHRNPQLKWARRWKEYTAAKADEESPESQDDVEPGTFKVTVAGDGDTTPMEVHFTWDETRTATWWCDVSEDAPGLSPGSSAPAEGWASWLNGQDVLIAFSWRDVGVTGWAHVVGGAPGKGDEFALFEKDTWAEFGRAIVAAVHGTALPGMTRQTYE